MDDARWREVELRSDAGGVGAAAAGTRCRSVPCSRSSSGQERRACAGVGRRVAAAGASGERPSGHLADAAAAEEEMERRRGVDE